ncbi:hypothetical protein CYMTET_5491 [Cymbomonas tetramitiformis]|uniref:Uncharacterized protein n=1 Tax=Cymbomonas tetramitiformis TaxID=36881 RepID=A0AAE0LJF0_9CHLO|nr:hypothetical protein CYMTET_5491 [Cymbomonas tetramitiformis]
MKKPANRSLRRKIEAVPGCTTCHIPVCGISELGQREIAYALRCIAKTEEELEFIDLWGEVLQLAEEIAFRILEALTNIQYDLEYWEDFAAHLQLKSQRSGKGWRWHFHYMGRRQPDDEIQRRMAIIFTAQRSLATTLGVVQQSISELLVLPSRGSALCAVVQSQRKALAVEQRPGTTPSKISFSIPACPYVANHNDNSSDGSTPKRSAVYDRLKDHRLHPPPPRAAGTPRGGQDLLDLDEFDADSSLLFFDDLPANPKARTEFLLKIPDPIPTEVKSEAVEHAMWGAHQCAKVFRAALEALQRDTDRLKKTEAESPELDLQLLVQNPEGAVIQSEEEERDARKLNAPPTVGDLSAKVDQLRGILNSMTGEVKKGNLTPNLELTPPYTWRPEQKQQGHRLRPGLR